MSMQTLPLHSLTLSALNVRTTERDADIAALAEDIAASGLKQNLVAIPAHFSTAELPEGADYGCKFEVIAGGRRLQALQLLAADGRLDHDWPVPVMVEQREQARQTSLSENLHRVAMNPADEFEAFAAIVEQARVKGTDADPVAYCAKRFGVTRPHVEGRLRLAALEPSVLEALRSGRIGIESAKAYAITSDHDHQLKVFAAQEKSKYQPHDARTVRDVMRGRTLPLDCKLARFVGLDVYRGAGGRTEAEMFMGEAGQERIIDTALLDALAKDKAGADAMAQGKKDGFAYGLLAFGGYDHNPNWPKPPAGFEKTSGWYPDLADTKKAARKPLIGVYRINAAGEGLDYIGHFGPVKEAQAESFAAGETPTRDWAAERAADARNRNIQIRAARMALGPVNDGHLKGTTLEGRAFWPARTCGPVEPDHTDETFVLVTLQIRVPSAEVEAQLADATLLVDQETAAAIAEAEALVAAAEAAEAAAEATRDEAGDDVASEDEQEIET